MAVDEKKKLPLHFGAATGRAGFDVHWLKLNQSGVENAREPRDGAYIFPKEPSGGGLTSEPWQAR